MLPALEREDVQLQAHDAISALDRRCLSYAGRDSPMRGQLPESRGEVTMAPPQLSIVVVAYNSRSYIERCLPSIQTQDVSVEVIVVDNGSVDGVVDWLSGTYPHVRVLALGTNAGYAAAANRGVEIASAPYVLVLNPDTVLHSGALREMLRIGAEHPGSLLNPKLIQRDGTVNACGNRMHYTGITTCIGLGDDPATFHGVHPIPLLSGAAILTERSIWLALGGFDESFFLYMEDTELSLRARLQGHELLCAADAIVMHDYMLKMSPSKLYYLERNRLLTVLKTYEAPTLIRLAPALLLTETATWLYAALKGRAYLAARWRGYTWLWHGRQQWKSARLCVQLSRRTPDQSLLADMTAALPLQILLGQSRRTESLERLSSWIYAPILHLMSRAKSSSNIDLS